MLARKRTLWAAVLFVGAGLTCQSNNLLQEQTSALIGPAGGTLQSADGKLTLVVPDGALARETELTARPLDLLPTDAVSRIYELGPDGLAFALPATLSIEINDDLPAEMAAAQRFDLGRFEAGDYEALTDSAYLEASRQAMGTLEHFSSYGVFATVCGDGVVRGSEACDDTELVGATCVTLGFGSGTLACGPACDLDTSGCRQIGCGDGYADGDEECDDGNDDDNDACTNECKEAVCGDGRVWRDHETCDDANASEADGCDDVCQIEVGYCCVDGLECYLDGSLDPEDPCAVCDVATSQSAWTPVSDTCEACDDDSDCGTGTCECAGLYCTVSICSAAECPCQYNSDGDDTCDGAIANGRDPREDCPGYECSESSQGDDYFYGVEDDGMGNPRCYFAADTAGRCDGAGVCATREQECLQADRGSVAPGRPLCQAPVTVGACTGSTPPGYEFIPAGLDPYHDCAVGACEGAGACYRQLGESCTGGDEICDPSLFCVDGVCCEAACDTASECWSCIEVRTGEPDGFCAPVNASVFDRVDSTDAASPVTCGGITGCSDPSSGCICEPGTHLCLHDNGTICTADADCASHECECSDATCTSKGCSAVDCDICRFNANGDGTCEGVIADGFDNADEECLAMGAIGDTCTGTGIRGCHLGNGEPCSTNSDCESDECECGDATCSAVNKLCSELDCGVCMYTADGLGVCDGYIAIGYDNADNECPVDVMTDGETCDGVGSCTLGCGPCFVDMDCGADYCECADPACSIKKCSPVECDCGFNTDGDTDCDGGLADGFDDPDDTCGPLTCNGLGQCNLPNGIPCTSDQLCESNECECADATCTAKICSAFDCETCRFNANADGEGPCEGIIAQHFDNADDECTAIIPYGDTCDDSGACCLLGRCGEIGDFCLSNEECESNECECADATCGVKACSAVDCGYCEFNANGDNICEGTIANGFDNADDDCPVCQACMFGTCAANNDGGQETACNAAAEICCGGTCVDYLQAPYNGNPCGTGDCAGESWTCTGGTMVCGDTTRPCATCMGDTRRDGTCSAGAPSGTACGSYTNTACPLCFTCVDDGTTSICVALTGDDTQAPATCELCMTCAGGACVPDNDGGTESGCGAGGEFCCNGSCLSTATACGAGECAGNYGGACTGGVPDCDTAGDSCNGSCAGDVPTAGTCDQDGGGCTTAVLPACTSCTACTDSGAAVSCNPIAAGDDTVGPNTCTGTQTCDGAGSCLDADGEDCSAAAECASGFCECADASCSTQACGQVSCLCRFNSDGDDVCEGVTLDGIDPSGDCPAAAGDGVTCNGSGACHLLNGQPCVTNSDCESSECECADAICSAKVCSAVDCGVCAFNANGDFTCEGVIADGFDNADNECGAGNCVAGACE